MFIYLLGVIISFVISFGFLKKKYKGSLLFWFTIIMSLGSFFTVFVFICEKINSKLVSKILKYKGRKWKKNI